MSKNLENSKTRIHRISEQEVKEYICERFEDVKSSNKMKNLVSFQAMNKYMIMSHDQEKLKILGNIVASYNKKNFSEIITQYEPNLNSALEKRPTIKTHSNVIMHIFGYFSKDFNRIEKEQFFKMLEQFRNNQITIGQLLSEINPVIYRFNNTYLASQTYFLLYADPQPANLFHILNQE